MGKKNVCAQRSRVDLSCTLLLLLLLARTCTASVLSSSSLETCVNDVNTATQDISCTKKLVLTLAVGNGQALQTETLDFDVSCIGR